VLHSPRGHRREAIERILNRLEQTLKEVGEKYPFYADPVAGRWYTSSDGNWTGGFLPGLLWLASCVTGQERYISLAETWAERLKERLRSDTVFRCFLFYYGAVLGAVLAGSAVGREIGLAGSRSLAESFNSTAQVFPLGGESEGGYRSGPGVTNVDSIMAVPLLCWAAREMGSEYLARIAEAHARRLAEWCVLEDGSVIQSVSFDPVGGSRARTFTHKGYSDSSRWARAQAWAILGYAYVARWIPDEPLFLRTAEGVADWWIDRIPPDKVAYWDFDDPRIPATYRDTSATAIAAAGMLKLATVSSRTRGERYRRFARDTIDGLVRDWLTPVSPADTRPPGILTGGCYNGRRSIATSHELIFGTYYLLEGLCVVERVIPAASV
jgi:unsaturated chondroitin disaccharide hydrolase